MNITSVVQGASRVACPVDTMVMDPLGVPPGESRTLEILGATTVTIDTFKAVGSRVHDPGAFVVERLILGGVDSKLSGPISASMFRGHAPPPLRGPVGAASSVVIRNVSEKTAHFHGHFLGEDTYEEKRA